MPKKLTNEIFIEKAKTIHGDLYDYGKVDYVNAQTKIKIFCKKEGHGIFEQRPNDHLSLRGCPKCGGKEQSNTEEFIEKAKIVHGDLYDYDKVDYINNQIKIIIICRKQGHGDFIQRPDAHLLGSGCPKCGGSERLTTKIFIEKAVEVHGDLYNYNKTNYVNSSTKIIITCRKQGHGDFEQKPSEHLFGNGCPKCAGNLKLSTEEFIEKAKIVHGDLYNYDKVDYINTLTKVIIICGKYGHGDFEQMPCNHLQGAGCPVCAGKELSNTEEFIEKAKIVHGDLYNYNKTNYVNSSTKIIITCRKQGHGDFEQTPNSHICGTGCPKCTARISLPEIIWLNINQIKPEFRQYSILKYKVDGYNPDTNTVYEFHGDYWHGNPIKFEPDNINKISHKTFGELYENTVLREQEIKSAGYNLVTIWGSVFNTQYKEQIKNYKLLHGAQKIVECNIYD
jgi:hypothetical protein